MSSTLLSPRLLDWVALFRRLTPDDRDRLAAHFLELEAEDRRLRFGLPVSDEYIRGYVAGIDFDRDAVYGAPRTEDGRWLGIGHLVLGGGDSAELGLSVQREARGRGLGAAIFRFAVADAARAGIGRLYMHCLATNRAVMSIARAAGMSMHSEGGETDAYLVVPPYPEFVRQLLGEPSDVS